MLETMQTEGENVYVSETRGRGRGTFAMTDLGPRSLVLQVPRPLVMTLDNVNIDKYCDFCYKSPYDRTTSAGEAQIEKLVRCKDCKIVRYCGLSCQRKAWASYHKYECRIYASQPRVLPTTNRALLRLMKQNEHAILEAGQWDDFERMEDHYADVEKAGGQKWKDFYLIAKKLKADSGTKLPLDKIISFVCRVAANSFSIINPIMEPIGLALDPKAALLNHSCEPNAFVRFDVPATKVSSTNSTYRSISVFTLRPVGKNEEITISYIDSTSPFEIRQQTLEERYHFLCKCEICILGPTTLLDYPRQSESGSLKESKYEKFKQIQALAEQCLKSVKVGTEGEFVDRIGNTMKQLAVSDQYLLHCHPWPQLRKQLVIGLIHLQNFEGAFIHCAILIRRIYPLLYKEEGHPIRVAELWALSQVGQPLLELNRNIIYVIAAAVDEMQRLLGVGLKASGRLEFMVDATIEELKRDTRVWQNFQKDRRKPWAWLDKQVDDQLKKEGVSVVGMPCRS